jgi:hypothetical protein
VTAPLIDILVPVLGRPQNAEPFLRSLAESDPGAVRVLAVPNADDTATHYAWVETAETHEWPFPVLVPVYPKEPGSFAQKCNAAARLSGLPGNDPAPWVFLVGDDVKFHPGWAAAALAAGARPNVCVVGVNSAGPLNDGSTPHQLVRRSYIADPGASWDGPGSLCHEGYRHNFVDVELAALAQERGVWVDAPDAVVEHLCVYQGKAPMDATYQISSDSVDADRALWMFRSQHFAGEDLRTWVPKDG